MDIWSTFMGMVRDQWAGVKAWRAKRDEVSIHSKPTYDPYPDTKETPEIKFYVEARDARGRLLREYVELEGYSMHQINWKAGARRGATTVRDWFIGQMLEALLRLEVRLDEVKESRARKEFPPVGDYLKRNGQGLAEYALILALIAIVAIVALIYLGGSIADILSTIGSQVGQQPGSTP